MTEFIGLDLEMAFEEHYHEVLEILEELLVFIFKGLKTRFSSEIETVKKQYPSSNFEFLPETLRMEYKDAVKLLRENNVEIGDLEDLRYHFFFIYFEVNSVIKCFINIIHYI
jgi:aspartyl/asparaginyl-tRNA synthetase